MNTKKKNAAAYPGYSVETVGTLIEEIAPGVYRASLPNGKVTVAHAGQKVLQAISVPLFPGTRVHLSLTPADFDHARITCLASQ